MLRFERRADVSALRSALSPLVALAATAIAGAVLFAALGKDPARGLAAFFVEPLSGAHALSELAVKATPLLLIALGLAVCFRASIWNIGAEGQFVLGAVGSGWVALHAGPGTGRWAFVAALAAGAAGGMAWAAIVAVLRDRFHANEILVSLMLVYVAEMLLSYLVYGPWKDPDGYNFPQTVTFVDAVRVPRLVAGYRAGAGVPVALLLAIACWVFLFRTYEGYQVNVSGLSPPAAAYAGFSARRGVWTALLVSGATAGLAGAFEALGPVGQLNPYIPQGYGFAAIIVAFLGRLHPAGVVLSSILMSMFAIGGELCQSRLGLPKALTGVFQGMLLFLLLAADGAARLRVRWVPAEGEA
jgi:simple sugar transport system permease protein